MRAYLKLFLLSATTAGAAWLASRTFVPDAVAVADIEQQPQWYLQLAFVLRSIELIGLGTNFSRSLFQVFHIQQVLLSEHGIMHFPK